jgi:hypothetical protein
MEHYCQHDRMTGSLGSNAFRMKSGQVASLLRWRWGQPGPTLPTRTNEIESHLRWSAHPGPLWGEIQMGAVQLLSIEFLWRAKALPILIYTWVPSRIHLRSYWDLRVSVDWYMIADSVPPSLFMVSGALVPYPQIRIVGGMALSLGYANNQWSLLLVPSHL